MERAPEHGGEPASGPAAGRGAAIAGLAVVVALMVLAMAVPAITGWDVHVKRFPPLHALWDPEVGVGTLPALLLALLAIRFGVDLAQTLSWRGLLLCAFALGFAWMFALAFVEGADGIGRILNEPYEYLHTARATTDLPATLEEYTARIPYDAPLGNWPVHIAGHPPGALTFFVVLVKLGLGSGFAAGTVVTAFAASTAVAVLITLRALGAEDAARKAAPFLVFGPAAIWQCVSADGMFAAVAAWGMAALAVAGARARERRWRWLGWAAVAGVLLGICVMLSYGLPLLGILALTVLYLSGSWRPLVPAALAALAVVLAYASQGFYWWEAVGALRERYWDGVASRRPGGYWIWGNIAALGFSAGPLLGAAAGAAVAARRRISGAGTRVAVWLTGAGAAMVLAADASQMSRAEVERIWLPFAPWILVGCALLPERWRRWGLGLQVVFALVVEHLLNTGW